MKTAMPPIINLNSRILILGSMPGEKSLESQQYYANRGNHFWKLLFAVFNSPFSFEYTDRLALLERHNIALWDVLAFCEREGSLDSRIKNEVSNDFDAFFAKYQNIRHVLFSSKMAEKYFNKYASKKAGIVYGVLPSPSGANAGKSFSQKLDGWQILAKL